MNKCKLLETTKNNLQACLRYLNGASDLASSARTDEEEHNEENAEKVDEIFAIICDVKDKIYNLMED